VLWWRVGLCLVGIGVGSSVAQEFRITQATLDTNHRPHVEFPGNSTIGHI
jgi:hypothetical protein